MNQGLFESLTGEFLDGTPIESVPQQIRKVVSVMDHLNRLFNTRQGTVSHLKDYGLPDVSELYRRMPDGVEELREAITTTVQRYEPRLTNVRVINRGTDARDHTLGFVITAKLKNDGAQVRFQTTFTSLGDSFISPLRKTD